MKESVPLLRKWSVWWNILSSIFIVSIFAALSNLFHRTVTGLTKSPTLAIMIATYIQGCPETVE